MESIVEIDENERYWVGRGFGKAGLLPNDRGAFSSTDGSMSWRTMEGASDDLTLLGRGWIYEKDSEFVSATNWMYASDFRTESIVHAKPDRGMSSFVRFRRLYRTKVFNPNEFVPPNVAEECDHVDSYAVDALSQLVWDVLTYCTLLHSPGQYTDAISLPLKHRVVDVVTAQKPQYQTTTDLGANSTIQTSGCADDGSDAIQSLEQLKKNLENFVEEERGKTIMNRLVRSVDFSFHQRLGKTEFHERQRTVESRCFDRNERHSICCLIVKKLDPNYQLHCDQPNCGDQCRFRRIPCQHKGCDVQISQMHLAQHMASCPFKLVTCNCGEEIPAREMEAHKRVSCPLRIVECPFKEIGCIKDMTARDMQTHVDNDMASHLILAMNRMMEHQQVIKTLNTKIIELETDKNTLLQTIKTNEEETKKSISQLEARLTKATKEITQLETTVKKNARKVETLS